MIKISRAPPFFTTQFALNRNKTKLKNNTPSEHLKTPINMFICLVVSFEMDAGSENKDCLT
jgi:hypothetical protein